MNKLFSIQQIDNYRVINLFGLKLKLPHNSANENIRRQLEDVLSCFSLHQSGFLPFKQKHEGQDVVIFASGPSAAFYKPIKNAVHIGINRSFCTSPCPLDYVFVQDYTGSTPEYLAGLSEYEPQKCTKFYGILRANIWAKDWTIPESLALKAKAIRYMTDWAPNNTPRFAYDLSVQPLGDFGSTVFSALQFALWTHPKRLYLVGCDCTQGGYSYNTEAHNNLCVAKVVDAYKQFKIFAKKHYPDVEIISINPIALKGLFTDEYTK